MNSTKICLWLFLMNRKKPFTSRGNIGNTVVNSSYTLTNGINDEFVSNSPFWNQINKKVDLEPMKEVEGLPESLPQTLVIKQMLNFQTERILTRSTVAAFLERTIYLNTTFKMVVSHPKQKSKRTVPQQ